eukprot:jgi/Mesvir1/22358/Mv17860-RA.1
MLDGKAPAVHPGPGVQVATPPGPSAAGGPPQKAAIEGPQKAPKENAGKPAPRPPIQKPIPMEYGATSAEPRYLACGTCGQPCIAGLDDKTQALLPEGEAAAHGRVCCGCQRNYHLGCQQKVQSVHAGGVWFCSKECEGSLRDRLTLQGCGKMPAELLVRSLNQAGLVVHPDAAASLDALLRRTQHQGYTVQVVEAAEVEKPRGHRQPKDDALTGGVRVLNRNFFMIVDRYHDQSSDLKSMLAQNASEPVKQRGCEIKGQKFVFRGSLIVSLLTPLAGVVATAVVRVYGRQLAEVPLFAADPQMQKHGTVLLRCLEVILAALKVQTLYVSSIKMASTFWGKAGGGLTRPTKEQHSEILSKFRIVRVAEDEKDDEKRIFPLVKGICGTAS